MRRTQTNHVPKVDYLKVKKRPRTGKKPGRKAENLFYEIDTEIALRKVWSCLTRQLRSGCIEWEILTKYVITDARHHDYISHSNLHKIGWRKRTFMSRSHFPRKALSSLPCGAHFAKGIYTLVIPSYGHILAMASNRSSPCTIQDFELPKTPALHSTVVLFNSKYFLPNQQLAPFPLRHHSTEKSSSYLWVSLFTFLYNAAETLGLEDKGSKLAASLKG